MLRKYEESASKASLEKVLTVGICRNSNIKILKVS